MRRNYRKFTALIVTSALLISLTGCGKNAAQIDKSVENSESSSISVSDNEADTISGSTAEEESKEQSAEGDLETGSTKPEADPTSEEETQERATREETSGADETSDDEKESSADKDKETTASEAASETETTVKETTVKETTTKEAGTTKAAVTVQSIKASVSGTHYIGDTLTGADFTITVTMSDGSTLTNPAGWSANPLTLSSSSNQITVAYEGVSTTITVQASEKPAATTAAPQTQPAAQPTTTQAPTPAPTTAPVQPTEPATKVTVPNGIVDGIGRQAFVIQNQYRAEAGVASMTWSDELYAIACIRAQETAAHTFEEYTAGLSAHQGMITNNENWAGNYFAQSYASTEAYNNAVSITASAVMQQWKDSSGHYRTLTTAKYQYGAIACYEYNSCLYCIAVFSPYDGFGEYETKGCLSDEAALAAIADGRLAQDELNPGVVLKIDYVKLFWYPKQIPYVAGLFENITFGDYCRSIGKYQ